MGESWTPEREAAALDRCERATPGPWRSRVGVDPPMVFGSEGRVAVVDGWIGEDDAAFIADARTDLPDAIAELRKLRAVVEAYRELVAATDESDATHINLDDPRIAAAERALHAAEDALRG